MDDSVQFARRRFHTYFVGKSLWAFNVWAHNSYGSAKKAAIADMAYEDALLDPHDLEFYKSSGNYELEFVSGMKYHGKGLEDRMSTSVRRLTRTYNDTLARRALTPANNDTDAFIEEARRIAADGGVNGGKLYNRINSPGINKG